MSTEALLSEMRQQLHDGGLHGCLLVRDLLTGDEVGIAPDTQLPAASLVKVPLALATAERIHRGELDGATMLDVHPGRTTTPGPTGLSRFRHPARIAIDDLLYMSTCVSDGAAADVLFGLTPPARVTDMLHEFGLRGVTVRHGLDELTDTPWNASMPPRPISPSPSPSTPAPAVAGIGCPSSTPPAPAAAAHAPMSSCCKPCGRRPRSIRTWPNAYVA